LIYTFPGRLQISPTMSNVSFRGWRELAMGVQLQQKVQNVMVISHCCHSSLNAVLWFDQPH